MGEGPDDSMNLLGAVVALHGVALVGQQCRRLPRDRLLHFLPRVFWGQNWGQNPGRCKPSKTSRRRIHWAVALRGAAWTCSRQRSNPYLPAILCNEIKGLDAAMLLGPFSLPAIWGNYGGMALC